MSSSSLRKQLARKQEPQKRQPVSKSPMQNQNRSVSNNNTNTRVQTLHNESTAHSQTNRDLSKSNNRFKFDSQMDIMEKQLKNNKNKLCSCMEIYGMLESNMQAQRCLQHNNMLSLYCINERRILCVNCLYGMHRHRSHKVVPLKDCMDQVYQDNKKLTAIIEEQLKKLDYYSKIAQQNAIVLQNEMRRILTQVEIDYAKKIDQIKAKYQISKQQIRQNFTPVIQKCKTVKRALQDFRFNVWKGYTLYNDQKISDECQIMKQLLFVTIVELCQFRNRTITKTQLDSLCRKSKPNF